MSPEDEKYFDALLDMFMTPGWKHFITDLEGSADALDTVSGVPDGEALYKRQGQLLSLTRILGFEDSVRRAMEDDDEAV
jgi:hypothetical protein